MAGSKKISELSRVSGIPTSAAENSLIPIVYDQTTYSISLADVARYSLGYIGSTGGGGSGTQGPIGYTGSQGPIGYTGSAGTGTGTGVGYTGSQGPIGYTGSAGSVGTIAAGSITIDKLAASPTAKTTANSTDVYLGSGSVAGYTPGLLLERKSSSTVPLIVSAVEGVTSTNKAAMFIGNHTGLGAYGVPSSVTSLAGATKWKSGALLGDAGGTAGYFVSYQGIGIRVDWVNAVDSAGTVGSGGRTVDIGTQTHAVNTYGGAVGPFTGSHDALLARTESIPEEGDIVVDHEVINRATVFDAITSVNVSTSPRQKNALGVFTGVSDQNHIPSALAAFVTETPSEDSAFSAPRTIKLLDQFANIRDEYEFVAVNSVGEGLINVCGENGNFEAGDLIVTSSMRGKGMKQDDDIVRSITVAKIREAVTFSSPTEVKKVACIYLCG